MQPGLFIKYVFTQPLHRRQDVTQGQFLSWVKLVCFTKTQKSCPALLFTKSRRGVIGKT